MRTAEDIEDEMIVLAEEIGEAEYNLSLMKAKYESLSYLLIELDSNEEF